jgi:hypothetical protein
MKHLNQTLATCVYSYFCNIHVKHLQHTSETSETIETYASNMLHGGSAAMHAPWLCQATTPLPSKIIHEQIGHQQG